MGKKKNKNRKGSGANNDTSNNASPVLEAAHSGNSLMDSVGIDEEKLPKKELPPVAVSPQQKAYDDTPASAEKRKKADDTLANAEAAASEASAAVANAQSVTATSNGVLGKTIEEANAASAAAKAAVNSDPDGRDTAMALDAAGNHVPKSFAQAQEATQAVSDASKADEGSKKKKKKKKNRGRADSSASIDTDGGAADDASSDERKKLIHILSGEVISGIQDAVSRDISEKGEVEVSDPPNMDFSVISMTDFAEARKSMMAIENPPFRLSLQPADMSAINTVRASNFTPLSTTKSGSGRSIGDGNGPFASIRSSQQDPSAAKQYGDDIEFATYTPTGDAAKNLDSEVERYVQDIVEGKDPTPLSAAHSPELSGANGHMEEDDVVEVEVTYDEHGRMSVFDITESGVPFYRHDMDDFMRERRKMSLRSELEDVTSHKIKEVSHLIGAGRKVHDSMEVLDPRAVRKMSLNDADALMECIRDLDNSIMRHTPGRTPQPVLSPATKRSAERHRMSPIKTPVNLKSGTKSTTPNPELELARKSPYMIPKHHLSFDDGDTISKADLNELRTMFFGNPPTKIQNVAAAVTILLSEEGTRGQADFGTRILKTIRDLKLIDKLRNYNSEAMTEKTAIDLREYTSLPEFSSEVIGAVSRSAAGLAQYVLHHERAYYARTGKTPLTHDQVVTARKKLAKKEQVNQKKTAYKTVTSKVKTAWSGGAVESEGNGHVKARPGPKKVIAHKTTHEKTVPKKLAGPPRVASLQPPRAKSPPPAPENRSNNLKKDIPAALKQKLESLAQPHVRDNRRAEVEKKKQEFLSRRPDSKKGKDNRPKSAPSPPRATSPFRVAMGVEHTPPDNRRKQIEEKKKLELAKRHNQNFKPAMKS